MTYRRRLIPTLTTSLLLAGLLLSLPLQAIQSTAMAMQMAQVAGVALPADECERCQPDAANNDCPLAAFCFLASVIAAAPESMARPEAVHFFAQTRHLHPGLPFGPEPPPPRFTV